MAFADHYFNKYKTVEKLFLESDNQDLKICVIIPCYDDFFIFKTLNSLNNTIYNKSEVVVIVIVNSSENSNLSVVESNKNIFNKLEENKNCYNFKLENYIIENVKKKIAGVGFARKLGMDEAVRKFNLHDNQKGIILSLDADTLVAQNYFELISETFNNNKKFGGLVLGYKHNFDTNLFSTAEINACKLYEKYLKYYQEALKFAGFPYYFHTIGSCFGVLAENYIKVGGMPCRQGGEDFYFLQKLAQTTTIGEIAEEIVFPSPRISNRVPFGTGPSVKKIIENGYLNVYNYELFKILKNFFDHFDKFYKENKICINIFPVEIMEFCGYEQLIEIIEECKQNSNSLNTFKKRMFAKFNAFWLIKFLNFFTDSSKFPQTKWLF